MLNCSSCAHENIDGTQFCEMCGEELPANAPASPAQSLTACPSCAHQNPEENIVCEACGADLQPGVSPTTTPALPQVASSATAASSPNLAASDAASGVGSAALTSSAQNLTPGTVKLVVEQGQTVGAQFVLGDAELLVGREDEDQEIYPDIDLSDQDAGYVHRQHATLSFAGGILSVTHLGGANKTRLNNKPLADHVATPVKLGDKIGFGKVVLRLLPL